MRRIAIVPALLAAITAFSRPVAAQSIPAPDSTIEFLQMLAGRWYAANTADGPARRPPPDYVVHSMEWTVGGKALRLREGFRAENSAAADLDGLVYWNPATERVEFVAVAGGGPGQGRVFMGEYRQLADGSVERTYRVTYRSLADTPGEELGGTTRRFRETYTPLTADSVAMRLDWWRTGAWQPFGQGRYTFVRRGRSG